MTEAEVKEIFVDAGAIMEGHFLLTSGLHSPMYVEKFNVLQHPESTEKLCKALAEQFRNDKIQTVVGPMTGGILLAHEVGKALGTRAIFTERENGRMTFKRGFSLQPGERVLIVEDIVTTGGSVKEVIDVGRSELGSLYSYDLIVDLPKADDAKGLASEFMDGLVVIAEVRAVAPSPPSILNGISLCMVRHRQ